MSEEKKVKFYSDEKEAFEQAKKHFKEIERGQQRVDTGETDPSEALKRLVSNALRISGPPVLVSKDWNRGSQWLAGAGLDDGRYTQIFLERSEELKEARERVLERAASYFTKTPLSYHSQFHGGVADELGEEET
jgi:hypothetical protein